MPERPAISAPQVTQARLLAGADVDDQPTPPLTGTDDRIDGIVDEQEVARPTPVTGDHGRRPGRRSRLERSDDSPVGTLARPVHRRQRERRELDVVQFAVDVEQVDHRPGHDTAHAARLERQFLEREIASRRTAVQRRGRHGDDDLRNTVSDELRRAPPSCRRTPQPTAAPMVRHAGSPPGGTTRRAYASRSTTHTRRCRRRGGGS